LTGDKSFACSYLSLNAYSLIRNMPVRTADKINRTIPY
jgi:hypothetical protein